jgi:hypothetical protein
MRPLSLFLLITVLLSCGREQSPGGGASIVDSAGVVIVTNSISEGAISEWSIESEPIVRVGGDREEPGQQLYLVTGAIRLSDGRLVVANAGSVEIGYYDRTGDFLRAVGGRGGGPGEFEWLDWIAKLDGDTIVAWDSSHRRASWFDGEGELVRSLTVRASSDVTWPSPVGVFGDGSLLVRQGFPPEEPFGLHRLDFRLLHYDPATDSMTPLGRFAGGDAYNVRVGRSLAYYAVPFGRSTAVGVADTLFYVAHNDRFEIRFYEPFGTLRRIVRRVQPVVPVTDEMAGRFREAALELVPSERRSRVESVQAEVPVPETVPAFGSAHYVRQGPVVTDVMMDEAGNLWVLEYAWHRHEATRWLIFGRDGVVVAKLTLPAGYQPLHIATDHVVLLTRDELDVEAVRVHRLFKGS